MSNPSSQQPLVNFKTAQDWTNYVASKGKSLSPQEVSDLRQSCYSKVDIEPIEPIKTSTLTILSAKSCLKFILTP